MHRRRTDFRTNKPSDVISTLVSIYDSKDLFVKELQVLLAQRLLAITDDNFEKVEKEVSIPSFLAYLQLTPFASAVISKF
jgi:hypothetical protein